MRIFTAVTLLLALLATTSLSACVDDGPPPAARQPSPPTISEPGLQQAQQSQAAAQRHDPQPATPDLAATEAGTEAGTEAAAEEATAEADPPIRNKVLIMRLEQASHVYPHPAPELYDGDHWRSGALLLADGWLEHDNGAVWLRLDMNDERVGWISLADSPLTLEEAQTLPKLEAPKLPTVEVQTHAGRLITISLLGRQENGRIVVLDTNFARPRPAWIDQWSLFRGTEPPPLPIYHREVRERWSSASELSAAVFEVEVWSGHRAHLWPGGPALPYQLRTGRYPVLGRSLDAAWIAVRVEQLHPPVVWLPLERVELDVTAAEMPVILSNALEIVRLDDDGTPISSTLVEEPSRWEWLNGTELLIHEQDQGTSIWDTETDERRWITEHVVYDVSPDRRYALRTFQAEMDDPEPRSRDRSVEIISLETGAVVRFDAAYNPPGRCGCSSGPVTLLRWSPDSSWLFSVRFGEEIAETERYLALSVDGRRVSVIPPDGESLYDWASLHSLEQAGVELTYLDEDGASIERPWSAEMLAASAEPLGEDVELGDGWWPVHRASAESLLLASRHRRTASVDDDGFATLVSSHGHSGVVEFGVFDEARELRQLFRGFGLDCGMRSSKMTLSPDGQRIAIGSKWTSCA